MRRPAEDCPRIEALSALLDSEIAGPEREGIEAHAATCPACKAAFQDFKELRGALRSLGETSPGVDVASMIAGRLDARRRATPVRHRPRWSWHLAPASLAAAGVLAAGAYLGMLLGGGAAIEAARPAAMAVFDAVPPGALCGGLPMCDGRRR